MFNFSSFIIMPIKIHDFQLTFFVSYIRRYICHSLTQRPQNWKKTFFNFNYRSVVSFIEKSCIFKAFIIKHDNMEFVDILHLKHKNPPSLTIFKAEGRLIPKFY
jgi:hypothetical protein